jgi:hypothetical protein
MSPFRFGAPKGLYDSAWGFNPRNPSPQAIRPEAFDPFDALSLTQGRRAVTCSCRGAPETAVRIQISLLKTEINR